MLALRAILFTILLPGLLTVYAPWIIRSGIARRRWLARFPTG